MPQQSRPYLVGFGSGHTLVDYTQRSQNLLDDLVRMNIEASEKENSGVSRECVTGYVLKEGIAGIAPANFDASTQCYPQWLHDVDISLGVVGHVAKKDVDLEVDRPIWKQTAMSFGRDHCAWLHVIGNVAGVVGNRPEYEVFQKIAGSNEPSLIEQVREWRRVNNWN
jgi:hypothetical protein